MKIEIGISSSFKKAFKKRLLHDKKLEQLFWKKLQIFADNPYDPSLRTHKLSGELEGLWSFSLTYELRIIFKFFG